MPTRDDLRCDLALALRLANRFDLNEGIDNHFSVAVPGEDDRYLINPYGKHWSQLTAGDMLYVDGEGNILEGEGKLDLTALHIHIQGHRARPDAVCIMHTHMPYATALTCRKEGRLRFVHQGHLRYWNRVTYQDEFGGLANDADEGRRLAEAAKTDIVFLANHGVIVHGVSVAAAWHDLYFLERACEVQILAETGGAELSEIPTQVADYTARQIIDAVEYEATSHFAAMRDVLADERPYFAS
ncbi:MAG: aldolase [Acuticoccus sp.]